MCAVEYTLRKLFIHFQPDKESEPRQISKLSDPNISLPQQPKENEILKLPVSSWEQCL
jgi:hypothetical protein